MNRIVRTIVSIEEAFISILLPIMCIVVFAGTVGRYTKLFTMPWGEELARYILVWIVFIGSAAAARKALTLLRHVVALILKPDICLCDSNDIAYLFCLFVIYYGFYITKAQVTMGQVSIVALAYGICIWLFQ